MDKAWRPNSWTVDQIIKKEVDRPSSAKEALAFQGVEIDE